ncbi:hypothetical protein SASPL_140400 [Salvia splendens]|uniref:Uncharacterized protein n=1 Tax=Salvia splendens TaxID=180675 RepID=A0A8X8WRK5_SALSN|nr:hypothetical protein SASPL_140400 [Salvia splendens]
MPMTLEELLDSQTSTETYFSGVEEKSSASTSAVLLDAAGNPIITFQQKVFRGERIQRICFFSVRKSSMIQFKTKLDMSMVANSKEDRCDFRIEGSWFERSCAIYARDTNNVIAQTEAKNIVSDQRPKLLISRSEQRPKL